LRKKKVSGKNITLTNGDTGRKEKKLFRKTAEKGNGSGRSGEEKKWVEKDIYWIGEEKEVRRETNAQKKQRRK
jgi:hypothetical protein